MEKKDFFKAGYIAKSHRFEGALKVILEVNQKVTLQKEEPIFININDKLVPFFIISFLAEKNGTAVMKVEDIQNEEEARELTGLHIYLPKSKFKESTLLKEKDIYGYLVCNTENKCVGKAKRIDVIARQMLLIVEYKNREALIPLNEETLLVVDHKLKKITLIIPEGLLDLY